MDYRHLRKTLCEKTGRSAADIDALTEGLAVAISHSAAELDSIAIPTFGTFTPVKEDECVVDNLDTGKKMLLPPQISLHFAAGAMLAKRINPSDELIH